MARDISGFLHMKKATASDSDIAEEWDEIEKLYERKLACVCVCVHVCVST